MRIINAIIIRVEPGPDKIYFETDLPSGAYPFTGTQDLRLDVARGTGEAYLKTHFPEVQLLQVIERKDEPIPFSRPAGWS